MKKNSFSPTISESTESLENPINNSFLEQFTLLSEFPKSKKVEDVFTSSFKNQTSPLSPLSLPLTFSASSAFSSSSSSASFVVKELDNISISSSSSDVYSPTIIIRPENQSSNTFFPSNSDIISSDNKQKISNLNVRSSLSSLDTLLIEKDKIFSTPFTSTCAFYDSEPIRENVDANQSSLTLASSSSSCSTSSLSSCSTSSLSSCSTSSPFSSSSNSNSTSSFPELDPSHQILSLGFSLPSLSHVPSLPDISLPLSDSLATLHLPLSTYKQPATNCRNDNGDSTS